MNKGLEVLQKVFGYDAYRPHQKKIVDVIAGGRDTLAVMPTGAGKSLCYQIPALLFSGMTLVISPLIALMKDQVQVLKENGVAAYYLNSSLNAHEFSALLQRLHNDEVKLLYIAPERLENEHFLEQIKTKEVSMVAVDEAHCISQWGHDFRPAYRNIGTLLGSLSSRPVITAFTATATKKVQEDILEQLGLSDPFRIVTGFDRPNLYFRVERDIDKDAFLLSQLKKDEPAIVYCSTRRAVDEVYAMLTEHGFSAGRYHAGMGTEERERMQEAFLYDQKPVMVATVAFGMGIDKPDVRKVIHYNLPGSIENYYQEAGRAGRDGEPAEAILLYAPADIYTQRFLLTRSGDTGGIDKLNQMVHYAETTDCLRHRLLAYFREESNERCGHCGNCDGNFLEKDITVDAQKILSCVYRCGERFGAGMIADVLTGSRAQKVRQFRLDQVSTYHIMPGRTKKEVMGLIDILIGRGYLTRTDDRFPIVKLNKKSREALGKDARILISVREETPKKRGKVIALREELTPYGQKAFEQLRTWRTRRAADEGVPAYVIASDRTLVSLLQVLPKNPKELLDVHGIGEGKAERIGADLLQFIQEHTDPQIRYVEQETAGVLKQTERPRKKPGDTQKDSYERFTKGESAEAIAAAKGILAGTVKQHLVQCLEYGMPLDIRPFVNEEEEAMIRIAIQKAGSDYLRPIKDELPEACSYDSIRFVRALLQQEEREKDRFHNNNKDS
jgi:ATP-dependent DNA helicase RecQ